MRVADGFLEKAARSGVRREKEVGRQVLGNERMATRSSIEFKKETLENVSGNREKAARSGVRLEKEIERQVLGNEGMARTQAQQLKGKGWKMCLEARKKR